MPDIRLVGLRKEYKNLVAVRDVTITFPTGTVTCLLGPSGCGKTTMMRMVAGLEPPTAGDVYFDDQRVTDLSPRERNIGMVFQYPVVYQGMSVYRNIDLPLREERLPEAERKRRIEYVVETLGLRDSVDKGTAELDLGTRQKVAVARAVARQPRIILLDEPITNVDIETKVQLKHALKQLSKQRDQTVIYVTHDQTEAMTLADRIALMKEGEIVQSDDPRRLYNFPNSVFGGWFLGNPGMNFFEHQVKPVGLAHCLVSPLFKAPLRITSRGNTPFRDLARVTLGIRPERVQIYRDRNPNAVQGRIRRKVIVVGGQFLVTIDVGGQTIKAKVGPDVGWQIHDEIWLECPLEWIVVFDPQGHRLEARLSV